MAADPALLTLLVGLGLKAFSMTPGAIGVAKHMLSEMRSTDLRALVRSGASDDDLAAAVRGIWAPRSDRYSELRSAATNDLQKVEMSYIGG